VIITDNFCGVSSECGAPVACSNTSSMKELAGDLLPTFDPTSADEIFHGLEAVTSKGWSAERRARGMEYAHTFNWRNAAQHVMGVYRSAL